MNCPICHENLEVITEGWSAEDRHDMYMGHFTACVGLDGARPEFVADIREKVRTLFALERLREWEYGAR